MADFFFFSPSQCYSEDRRITNAKPVSGSLYWCVQTGKATPGFQAKHPRRASRGEQCGAAPPARVAGAPRDRAARGRRLPLALGSLLPSAPSCPLSASLLPLRIPAPALPESQTKARVLPLPFPPPLLQFIWEDTHTHRIYSPTFD